MRKACYLSPIHEGYFFLQPPYQLSNNTYLNEIKCHHILSIDRTLEQVYETFEDNLLYFGGKITYKKELNQEANMCKAVETTRRKENKNKFCCFINKH